MQPGVLISLIWIKTSLRLNWSLKGVGENVISGDLLTNAFPTLDKGSPVVSFEFNNKGGRKFGKITTENIRKKLAIILDNKVISYFYLHYSMHTGVVMKG